MRFNFIQKDSWPPLAWLARLSKGNETIEVSHGARVECGPEWFCEAVWDGDYEDGDFDTTDVVFGSGARIRNGQVTFVTSAATVDRLQSMQVHGVVVVSNSLVCLMAETDAVPDITHKTYSEDFDSIVRGIDDYKANLDTSKGPIRFTYFRNLHWDGNELSEGDKPIPKRDFGSFATYKAFLLSSLAKIARNMSAPSRKSAYKMVGTLSSGYDSTTVTTLAREVGLAETFSFGKARSKEADSGHKNAELLGLRHTVFDREGYRLVDRTEIPFIAADSMGGEVFFGAAASVLRGRVLLTGFHGDAVWDKFTEKTSPRVERADRSGLCLTEFRLWAEFIHFPLPFLGVTQVADIKAISNSAEMAPWDYTAPGNWDEYTRPICRRIAEEAGVPRDAFGISKKATSVLFFNHDELPPASKKDYLDWLVRNRGAWTEKGLPAPFPVSTSTRITYFVARALFGITPYTRDIKGVWRLERLAARIKRSPRLSYLYTYLFPWAVERAKTRYLRG